MKATRYMRKPFICKGFEVTDDNMDAIARWCKGSVVRDDVPRPFVRVPVLRPTNERQTRAYVGTHVIVSIFDGVKSYKVYKPEWLLSTFFELDTWDGDEADDILVMEEPPTCCGHLHHINQEKILNTTPKPRPPANQPIFRPARTP
jgi:hypothetical protein